MYHPFMEVAAMILVNVPITLATLAVCRTVLHFLPGFAIAGQFL